MLRSHLRYVTLLEFIDQFSLLCILLQTLMSFLILKLNGWTGRDDFRIKAELLQKELTEMQEKVWNSQLFCCSAGCI